MMTTDEMIAVLTAYKEGKAVQVRYIDGAEIGLPWGNAVQPVWDFSLYDYRIKPEEPKPKYRPYESAEEVMEWMKLYGQYLKDDHDNYQHISALISPSKDNPEPRLRVNGKTHTMTDAYLIFTWPDGTLFGVKEEEK